MAELTWRNVAAPDFSGSMNGINAASELIQQALSQAGQTVNQIDQSRSEQFNKGLLLDLAGIADPTAAKTAIPGLLARAQADPRRVSAATLGAIQARPGELIRQAADQLQLDRGQYQWKNEQERDTALKQASPFIREAAVLADKGDRDGARAILAKAADIQGLPAETFVNALQTSTGLANSDLGYRRGIFGFGRDQIEAGRSDTAYNEGRAATALAQKVWEQTGGEPDAAEQLLRSSAGQYSPQVLAAARGQLGLSGYRDLGGSAAGGGGAIDGDPTRIMNYEARGAGFAAVPADVKTLGQASSFATQVNKAGVGSSAMGLYQIVGQTMRGYAPKVFGAGWQSVEFNAENQDKLARAIFEDNRGSADALRKQWVSLSQAEAEMLRRLPWEQARDVISRKESGAAASSLLPGLPGSTVRAPSVQKTIEPVAAQGGAFVAGYAQSSQDVGSSPIGVAQALKKGPLASASEKWISGKIQEIQAKASKRGHPVTAATAGNILVDAYTPQGFFEGMFKSGSFTVDDTVVDQKLNMVGSNQLETAVNTIQRTAQGMGNLQGAEARVQQAQARLENARRRGLRLDPFMADLALAQAVQGEAQAQIDREMAGAGGSGDRTPNRQVLPPPPSQAQQSTGRGGGRERVVVSTGGRGRGGSAPRAGGSIWAAPAATTPSQPYTGLTRPQAQVDPKLLEEMLQIAARGGSFRR